MDSQSASELQVLDSEKSRSKSQAEREECKKRCISKFKIIWSFISFLISVADVTVIIWLSYLHFSHSQDMLAWLMLLPILLNFIGIFTFLSNEAERKEMEALGCQKTKHFMEFPVIGPAFSSLRLFSYAFEETNADKYERLESLLMKMKQYEAFFRAAPEAFIQITFRIVTWSNTAQWHSEERWTSLCIVLCMFALAESNIYAPVRPAYYRLFNYSSEEDIWRVDGIPFSRRIGLFIFNFLSIGSRLFADALLRATACFYFQGQIEYGEVIILTFIFQFIIRAIFRAIYQNTLMTFSFKKTPQTAKVNATPGEMEAAVQQKKRKDPNSKYPVSYIPVQEDLTGVYGAFTYSWRCLFMSFDFQDWVDPIVFFWFYIENVLMVVASYSVIYAINYDLSDKSVYYIYTGSCCIAMVLPIILKYVMVYFYKKKKAKQIEATKF